MSAPAAVVIATGCCLLYKSRLSTKNGGAADCDGICVGNLREFDGVSTNAQINGVTGHAGTSHNDAVAATSSRNRAVQNRSCEQERICTSAAEDRVAGGNIQNNIVSAIKADVVFTCTTFNRGCKDADG